MSELIQHLRQHLPESQIIVDDLRRLAYGTDKGDEYFVHMADEAQAGKLSAADMKVVRDELDSIASKGALPLELHHARTKIEAALVASKPAAPTAGTTQPAAQGAA